MKHGSGMKDRDDKSNGIEILMTDAFVKIKPTDPFRFTKHREDRGDDFIRRSLGDLQS